MDWDLCLSAEHRIALLGKLTKFAPCS